MSLHPVLEESSFFITNMPLCQVRLMNNCLFPWIILIPNIPGVKEIIDLNWNDRLKLMEEICIVSEKINKIFTPDKLNVAMLGNEVSQLHVHIIGRYKIDEAWPKPVWNSGSKPYNKRAKEMMMEHLKPLIYITDKKY